MTPEETAARLVAVETHLAHVEREVEALHSVLVTQGEMIARLRRQAEQMASLLQGAGDGPPNERPPHYLP